MENGKVGDDKTQPQFINTELPTRSNAVTLHDPANQLDQPQQAHRTYELCVFIYQKRYFCGDFLHTHQVLVNNAITGSKEGEDMRNEVFLLRLQGLPVLEVFGKVHLKQLHD